MTERIEGIIDRLTDAEQYSDIEWILNAPVVNIAWSVVDDTMKANADFQYKAGLPAKVVRTMNDPFACEWCQRWAGTYDYPDVPKQVWQRHDRCECIIQFFPAGGGKPDIVPGVRKLATDKDAIKARKAYAGIEKPTPAQIEALKLYGITETD